jgi:uncharacterized protein YsxB (DUF464 family)
MIVIQCRGDHVYISGHATDADDPDAPAEHLVGVCAAVSMMAQGLAVHFKDDAFIYDDANTVVLCKLGPVRHYVMNTFRGIAIAFPKLVRVLDTVT